MVWAAAEGAGSLYTCTWRRAIRGLFPCSSGHACAAAPRAPSPSSVNVTMSLQPRRQQRSAALSPADARVAPSTSTRTRFGGKARDFPVSQPRGAGRTPGAPPPGSRWGRWRCRCSGHVAAQPHYQGASVEVYYYKFLVLHLVPYVCRCDVPPKQQTPFFSKPAVAYSAPWSSPQLPPSSSAKLPASPPPCRPHSQHLAEPSPA